MGKELKATWQPLRLSTGWYVLPTFRYLALTGYKPKQAHNGLAYAAPEMMALANLLSHPTLTQTKISLPIEGREIRRCSKDLGRVLAIARLANRAG